MFHIGKKVTSVWNDMGRIIKEFSFLSELIELKKDHSFSEDQCGVEIPFKCTQLEWWIQLI